MSVLIAVIPLTAPGATKGPHSPEAQNDFHLDQKITDQYHQALTLTTTWTQAMPAADDTVFC